MSLSREDKFALQKEAAVKSGSKFIQITLPRSQLTGEMHYKLEGNENTDNLVVFIHGIGGGMLHFREQMSALSGAGYRVLCFDFFGRGLSLPPLKTGGCCSNNTLYDTIMHIEQVHCLMEALNLLNYPRITLCGFSMGGAITMRFLDEYCLSNIKNVVLLSPAGLLNSMPIIKCFKWCCWDCLCPFGLNFLTSCLGGISKPEEKIDRDAFHNTQSPIADEMVRCTAEYFEVNDLQTAVFKSAVRVKELTTSKELVSRVMREQSHLRFLFIWSGNDLYVPMNPSMERFREICSQERGDSDNNGYSFEVIEDCGHCSMLEATEKVNDLILEFLKQ